MRAGGRRITVGLLLGLATAGAMAPSAVEPAPAQRVAVAPLVEELLSTLRSHAVMTAEFVQHNRWLAFAESDTARGCLTLVPPDRFRLEYVRPPGHLVGSDGRYVWTVVPEERQVLRAPLAQTTGWGELFYRGLDAPRDSLAPVHVDAQWGRVAAIALQPQPEWGLRELDVRVQVATGRLVGYAYTDEEGNRTTFRFEQVAFGGEVDSSVFRFSVPEGYELFDAGR